MGTQYEVEDWVVFLTGVDGDSDDLRRLQEKFESRFYKVATKATDGRYDDILSESWDSDGQHDAFLAFGSIMGHGVGLWEDEEPHHLMLEGAVLKDKKLGEIAHELDMEMYDLDPDNQ